MQLELAQWRSGSYLYKPCQRDKNFLPALSLLMADPEHGSGHHQHDHEEDRPGIDMAIWLAGFHGVAHGIVSCDYCWTQVPVKRIDCHPTSEDMCKRVFVIT